MTEPWYNSEAVRAVLNSLSPSDVTINEHNDSFIWSLEGDDRFEDLRRHQYEEISLSAGVTFHGDMTKEQHRRWMEAAASVPTIQDALNSRFGDPNVFKPLSVDDARKFWDAVQMTDVSVNVYDDSAVEPSQQSSNVARVDYFPKNQILSVLFKGGRLYEYFDVPLVEVDGLRAAKSKGGYIYSHIRDHYKVTEI